ncbi:MAG: oxygenase MpaB family protein [Pseudomonadota bacterium]|nr:oxygenase MpaB family protein [Pseudomonadota bacterium]
MVFAMRPARLHTQPSDFTFAYGRSCWPSAQTELQALRRVRRWLLRGRLPCPSPRWLAQIECGYAQADPLVDQLITDGIRLDQLLKQPDLHPHGAALQQQMQQLLPDIDPDLVRIGAAAYRRYPLLQIWLLRNVALMAGYSIPALSMPLLHSGGLVKDTLPRLYRTYAFIQAVSRDDALEVGGVAWQHCVQVRQIHAHVRNSLSKNNWDNQYWGMPLNQSDMIATHLQFSLLIVLGYRWFGARITADEQRGIIQLWRQISVWLGVDQAQLPETEQDALAWLYAYVATQRLDYRVGQPLAQALHDLPTQIVGHDSRIARWTEAVNASITRLFVGDDVADGLGLPKPIGRYAILLVPPLLFGLESIAHYRPKTRMLLNRIAAWRHQRVDRWMRLHTAPSSARSAE